VSAVDVFELYVAQVRAVPPGCDEGLEPEYECYVYASDYDSVVVALRAYADALEELHAKYREKRGAEVPGVAEAVAEARSLLEGIPRHRAGDVVSSEERNRMVLALLALARATLKLEGALG